MAIWVPRTYDRAFSRIGPWTLLRTVPPDVVNQVEWSLFFGSVVFIVILVFDKTKLIKIMLKTFAGVCALAGLPLVALAYPGAFFHRLGYLDRHLNRFALPTSLLICELLVAVMCGVLYYLRRWPFPTAANLVLLILHFSFWSWLSGTHQNSLAAAHAYYSQWASLPLEFWFWAIFFWGFPLLGFLSSIAWGACINRNVREVAEIRTLRGSARAVNHGS